MARNFAGNSTLHNLTLGDPADLRFRKAMTVFCRFKPDVVAGANRAMAGKLGGAGQRSWVLYQNATGTVNFQVSVNGGANTVGATSVTLVSVGTWYGLGGVFIPGRAVQCFVNGVLEASTATSGTTQHTDNGLDAHIGGRGDSIDGYDGDLAEFVLYDFALTPAEMALLYRGGPALLPYRPLRYYPIIGATPEPDWSGHRDVPVVGTTVAPHPVSTYLPNFLNQSRFFTLDATQAASVWPRLALPRALPTSPPPQPRTTRDFPRDFASYLAWPNGYIASRLNDASGVTAHCWARADGFSTVGTSDNELVHFKINTNAAGVFMGVNANTNPSVPVLRVGGRSVAADSFQSTDCSSQFTTGVYHACGVVLNYAGDRLEPWFDGVVENAGTKAFSPNFVAGTPSVDDAIGSNGTSTNSQFQFDGRISDVALWRCALSPGEMRQLAAGMTPLLIRPEALVFYAPLGLPDEMDLIGGRAGVVTGTGFGRADGPPVVPIPVRYRHVGQTPPPLTPTLITIAKAVLALAGKTVQAAQALLVPKGALIVGGRAATGRLTAVVAKASLVITGKAVTASANRFITIAKATMTVVGKAVKANAIIRVAKATMVVSGRNVFVAGQVIVSAWRKLTGVGM